MSSCIYCNKPAGFFSKKHSECEQIFNEGIHLLADYTNAFFLSDQAIDSYQQRINTLSESYFINGKELILHNIKTWGKSIKTIIKDSSIKDELLHKLFLFQDVFIIKQPYSLEQAFGKVNLEVGKKYKYYYDEYEIIKDSGSLVLCKDLDGKLKVLNLSLLKYYEKIEKLTEEAILDLLDFQEKFIRDFFKNDFKNKVEPEVIKQKIDHYKKILFVQDENLRQYINVSFEGYLLYLREEVNLKDLDESYVLKIKSILEIKTDDINKKSAYSKFVQLFILKDIEDGKFPQRVAVTNDIPFNLQKGEKVIWLSNDVEFFEEKVSKHYEGGHIGMSFRVANGMYLRTGGFKGRPVETTDTKFITTGVVGYTNRHLYFFSFKKSFKIRYNKIISLIPHLDGIIIMTEGESSKPIILKNEDGVFIYNLITVLTKNELSI